LGEGVVVKRIHIAIVNAVAGGEQAERNETGKCAHGSLKAKR
jgi:hypothetical protein